MKNQAKNLLILVLGLLLVGGGVMAYNSTAKVVVEGDYIEAQNEESFGGFYPSPDIVGIKEMTESLAPTDATATTTLKDVKSGTTYYLSATGTEIVLPQVYKGLNFRFVVGGALDTANVVIKSAEGDNIEGTLIVAGAVVDCAAEDQINFITDGENIGDYVEVRSDGTQWLIGDSGVLTSAKMTCTDPS